MAASDDEKRNSDREPVTLFVEYEGADDLVGDYTENLSHGGTFVATNRELPIGTKVQLVLSFPGLLEPISIEGIVRWTRGDDAGSGAASSSPPARRATSSAVVIDRIRARDPKTMSRLFRVLVVEDNRHVANLIHDGLKGSARAAISAAACRFTCAAPRTAAQAIEMLRSETFDALIIDVYLPVLDGAKVIQVARTELGLTDAADHRGVRRRRRRSALRARSRCEHLSRQADAAAPGDRDDPAPARLGATQRSKRWRVKHARVARRVGVTLLRFCDDQGNRRGVAMRRVRGACKARELEPAVEPRVSRVHVPSEPPRRGGRRDLRRRRQRGEPDIGEQLRAARSGADQGDFVVEVTATDARR